MSALENAKHEAFCREYATSNNTAAAHAKIYGKGKSARVNLVGGKRLLKIAALGNRIAILRREMAPEMKQSLVLSMEERRAFLALVVRTPIGQINKNSVLCQTWKVVTTEFGGSEEFKMPCKLRAIELDAKLAGELTDQVKVTGNVTLTLNDLKSRVLSYRERAGVN